MCQKGHVSIENVVSKEIENNNLSANVARDVTRKFLELVPRV